MNMMMMGDEKRRQNVILTKDVMGVSDSNI